MLRRAARLASSALARRLAGRAVWSMGGSGAARLLALLAAVLVARALGAASFGEYNLVQTTAGMAMALGGFGLDTTATRFLAGSYRGDPEGAGRVIALSAATALVVGGATAALLAAMAPFVARELLATPWLAPDLRVASLLVVLGPVNGAQLGVLMGLERFRLMAIASVLAALASAPVLVAGARLGGVHGGVVALLAAALVTTAIYAAAVRCAARAAGIRVRLREALR